MNIYNNVIYSPPISPPLIEGGGILGYNLYIIYYLYIYIYFISYIIYILYISLIISYI